MWTVVNEWVAAASGTLVRHTLFARSAATMMRRRSSRSASAPANSPKKTYGMASPAATKDTSSGECVFSYTRTGMATYATADPAPDRIRESQKRRKLRT